jgi:hypothetical protein
MQTRGAVEERCSCGLLAHGMVQIQPNFSVPFAQHLIIADGEDGAADEWQRQRCGKLLLESPSLDQKGGRPPLLGGGAFRMLFIDGHLR